MPLDPPDRRPGPGTRPDRWVRVLALGVGLVTLAIAGIFVGAVVWPPPAPRSASADGAAASAARVTRETGRWTVTAEVVPAGASVVAIVVSIVDADGRVADRSLRPTAVLRMTDMAMGTQVLDLVPEEPGRWRGTGTLSMSGRWRLELDVDGDQVMVPFESAP